MLPFPGSTPRSPTPHAGLPSNAVRTHAAPVARPIRAERDSHQPDSCTICQKLDRIRITVIAVVLDDPSANRNPGGSGSTGTLDLNLDREVTHRKDSGPRC